MKKRVWGPAAVAAILVFGSVLGAAPANAANGCSIEPYAKGRNIAGACTGNTYYSSIQVTYRCGFNQLFRNISIGQGTQAFEVAGCAAGYTLQIVSWRWVVR